MKKFNIDVSAMIVSEQERAWSNKLVFDNITEKWVSENRDNPYVEYFPPIEKKLNDKIAVINFLKLKDRSNLKILDIGTGCGHFMVLARSLGHTVSGTEIPESIEGLKEIHSHYNISPFPLYIKAQTKFSLPEKYNIITASRTVFDEGNNWTVKDWNFFKDNIFDYLEKDGELFIKTNIKNIPNAGTFLESVFGKSLLGWNSVSFYIKK